MSANFYWEPIKPGRSLPVHAPSSFTEALERALDGRTEPWVMTCADVPVLRGLRAGLADEYDAITALLDAIEYYGEVRVWKVY